jgi:uncharacterized protein (TIGR03437 family)
MVMSLRAYCLAVLLPACAAGQVPTVFPGGVVNAASFARAGAPFAEVAPGSLVAIFGTNLAAATASAEGFPLPRTLAGTSVAFDGISAPLLYVSPGQINAQLPSSLPAGARTVVVTTGAGSSQPVQFTTYEIGLGIFTLDGSGCGRAAVLNVAANGTLSLNSPANSIEPGGIVAVFGTGLGVYGVVGLPPDGYPAPANPPASLGGISDRTMEGAIGGEYTNILFAGRAPGFAGLDQYNTRVPSDAQEGCSVPLWVGDTLYSTSQTVPISIRRGGGQCVDPPVQSTGLLWWKKTVYSASTPPPTTEELQIEFSAGPGKQPWVPPELPGVNQGLPPEGPHCPSFEDWTLDGGIVTATAPGLSPLSFAPQMVEGRPVYVANLPAGTIRQGGFMVTGAGGTDVGAFTSALNIPPPIQLTTNLAPGTVIPYQHPLTITWTGGTAGSTVRVVVILKYPNTSFRSKLVVLAGEVPASQGQMLLAQRLSPPDPLGVGPGWSLEIVITVSGEADQIPTFQAPGLTLGGRHGWTYEYHFTDIGT